MRRIFLWAVLILVVVAIGVVGGIMLSGGGLPGATSARLGVPAGQGESITQTVEIRPADSVIGRVSAAGNIALSSQHHVVLEVGALVHQVNVKPGDQVAPGDPLVTLDATELERALRRVELDFQTAQNSLAQLQEPADADELAQSEAELLSAQANLEDIKAGPSADELAAAQAKVTSTWAAYQDLTDGMSEAERTSMEAQLRTAEVALQVAQRAYDQISWQGDAGMTSQAADLQEATIEYERVKAEFEIEAATSEADVQSALSSAREAEQQLADLRNQPTPAQIAEAEAQVAGARAGLEQLKRGANGLELEAAQLQIEGALVDLEEAHSQLQKTRLMAPMSGTVMEVHAQAGQQLSAGESVVVLADTRQLELPVLVAEVDIDQVEIGQAAEIIIDALLGRPFEGAVTRIAPSNDAESSVVNYQVIISLTGDDLTGVRPGMTAIAELVNSEASAGWLVPTTSLVEAAGETVVTVLRNDQPVRVTVAPGGVQGEWTVVQSAELRAGDQVMGSVASYVAEDAPRFGPGGDGDARSGPAGGD